MTWATAVMVYVVVWWLAWFAVLPIGVHVPDKVPVGQATSAPSNPGLLWKAGLASVIAAVLWALIYWLIVFDPFGIDLTNS